MLLTSIYTPTTATTTDIPVLIVCYGARKRFMLKAHTYPEMIHIIRQKFDIDCGRDISLETGALDVCHGRRVEIDEDAWPIMRVSLDEINVIVSTSPDTLETLDTSIRAPELEPAFVEMKEHYIEELLEKHGEDLREPGIPSLDSIRPRTRGLKVHFAQRDFAFGAVVGALAGERDRASVSPLQPRGESEEMGGYECKHEAREAVQEYIELQAETRGTPEPTEASHHPDGQPQESLPEEESLEQRIQVQIKGPQPDQIAEIKTRGKHLVKKVIAAVCNTFGLDYKSASLYLVVSVENGDGGVREECLRCPPEYSMAQCGVTSTTKLRIEIEPPTPAAGVTPRSK